MSSTGGSAASARHAHPLRLPARQLGGTFLAVHGGIQAHEVQQLVHALRGRAAVAAQQVRDGRHVLRDAQVREQPDLLDDVPDAAPQRLGLQGAGILAAQQDAAPVGSIRRLIIRSVVVFPQPDGPSSAVSCPPGT